MIKKILNNTIVKCAIILVASVILGFQLLCLSEILPTGERTENNMKESAVIFKDEGSYPKTASKHSPAVLDNFTDALILLTSADKGDENLSVKQNMINSRYPIISEDILNPRITFVEHYLNNTEYLKYWNYSRYWSGYQAVTRPLIRLFNLHQIRIINMIFQMALMILAVFLMCKKNHKYLIAPLIITWLMLVPMTVFKSLQYSPCFYGMILGVIGVLMMKEPDDKKVTILLLSLGIFTAYFDLLTFPVLTCGVPLAAYLAVKNESSLKKNIFSVIKTGLAWVIGYGGMWAGKWILGGPKLIENALNQAGYWSGADGSPSRIWTIKANIGNFTNNDFSILIIIFATVIITLIALELKGRKKLKILDEAKHILSVLLPYALVFLIPIVWYFVVVGHSAHHRFFTFRALGVSLFAFMVGIVQVYRFIKRKKK